jgi:hypothetical protein
LKTSAQIKLEKLEARLKDARKQVAAEAKAAKAKELAATSAEKAKKAQLVGTFVLAQMEKGGIGAALLSYEGVQFSDWLTDSANRILFGLPPHQE